MKYTHVITARFLTLDTPTRHSVNMSTADTRPPQWRPHDTLGARLVLLRRELGLTQREAAARAGIPFGQWQGLEDDDRQSRGLDVKVARIARAFHVDRDWLMWGGALVGPDDLTPAPGGGAFAGRRIVTAAKTRLGSIVPGQPAPVLALAA